MNNYLQNMSNVKFESLLAFMLISTFFINYIIYELLLWSARRELKNSQETLKNIKLLKEQQNKQKENLQMIENKYREFEIGDKVFFLSKDSDIIEDVEIVEFHPTPYIRIYKCKRSNGEIIQMARSGIPMLYLTKEHLIESELGCIQVLNEKIQKEIDNHNIKLESNNARKIILNKLQQELSYK